MRTSADKTGLLGVRDFLKYFLHDLQSAGAVVRCVTAVVIVSDCFTGCATAVVIVSVFVSPAVQPPLSISAIVAQVV